MTVMWQLDEARPGKLIVEGPGGKRELDVEKARIAEAKIEGLTPASRYRYRVEVDGASVPRGELGDEEPAVVA